MKYFVPLGSLVFFASLFFVAIGIDARVSEAAPEDDIEAAFNALVEAWNDEDIDAFARHFTDEGIAYQFYGLTGDEAVEAVAEDRMFLGPIVASTISNISVSGSSATAEVEFEFEAGLSLYEEWEFHLVDGAWLAGPGTPLFRPIPEGVPQVSLTLQEYAFVYDKASVAGGNFGFNVTNVGEEEHEVVIVGLPGDRAVSDVVDAVLENDELPEWAELVNLGNFFQPGVSGTIILDEPLQPGRYALLCFLPAPDETLHAALGMTSEFTVGSASGVAAPSAGSGGLADGGSGRSTTILVAAGVAAAVVVALVLGKVTLSKRSR